MTMTKKSRLANILQGALCAAALLGAALVRAEPAKPPTAPSQKKAAPTCKLRTTEVPRGGRLEVEGSGFGKAPLVRIGERVTRIIERTETLIAAQVHADSDGGAVSLQVGSERVTCGTLTIIGKDG